MKKASIRELHINTSQFVREAAEGNIILIERRGEAVAELRPITASTGISAAQKARLFASMKKIWKKMPQVDDSTRIVAEDRDR